MNCQECSILLLAVFLLSSAAAGQQQAPTASIDEESLPLAAAEEQVLTGETNLESGTEIEVSLRSETASDPFLVRQSARVAPDGSFEVVFDMSNFDVGSEYEITVGYNRTDLLEQRATLAEPGQTPTPSPEPTRTATATPEPTRTATAEPTPTVTGSAGRAPPPADQQPTTSSGDGGLSGLSLFAVGGGVVGALGVVGVLLLRRSDADGGDSSTTNETVLEAADQALSDARAARSAGEYPRAIERFETAVTQYAAAADDPSLDEDRRQAVEDSLASARAGLAAAEQRQKTVATLETALSEGGSALQTALTAHADGQTTVARSRYQQATSAYERALDALDDADGELLGDGLTVAWNAEATSPPATVEAVPALGDGETLAEAGIETRADYEEAAAAELAALGGVHRLLATAWWESEVTAVFASRREVRARLDVARRGIELL